MTRIIRLLPIAAILLLSAPFPAHAQVVGATLTGTVHDPSGATVSGATVTIRQTETGGKRVLVTDAEGRFFAPSIPVGPYTVTVEHDGFARQEQTGIALTIGQSLQLNFALSGCRSQSGSRRRCCRPQREHDDAANRRAD